MTPILRKALGATSLVGMALSLAACEPDELASVSGDTPFSLMDATGPLDWPVDDYGPGLAMNDPGYAPGDWAPLAAAAPMRASAPSGSYGYAPAWDYPDDYYYDDGPQYASYGYDEPGYGYGAPDYDYYDQSASGDSYALLALAAVLGSVIGNSPPDYAFDYGPTQPWAWETSDRYVRYAEPLRTGYRYYYYSPGAARPFLVRDPQYTYGYRGDRLVVVYDSYGRVLERERAQRLRRAASSYYDRGGTLYLTSRQTRHYGVSAPLWQQRSRTIVADQTRWESARDHRKAWKSWDNRYDRVVDQRWQGERVARRYAANRFANWQKADYRGPAPRVREEVREQPRLRQAVFSQPQPSVLRTARDRRIERSRTVERSTILRREAYRPDYSRSDSRNRASLVQSSRPDRTSGGNDRRSLLVRNARKPDSHAERGRALIAQRSAVQQRSSKAQASSRMQADTRSRLLQRRDTHTSARAPDRGTARLAEQRRSAAVAQSRSAASRKAEARRQDDRAAQSRAAVARQAEVRKQQQQRASQSRSVASRQAEARRSAQREAEARQQKQRASQARVEASRQAEARRASQRQTDARQQQRASLARAAASRQAETRRSAQRQAEARQQQQRAAEARSAASRQAEARKSVQRQADAMQAQQRSQSVSRQQERATQQRSVRRQSASRSQRDASRSNGRQNDRRMARKD